MNTVAVIGLLVFLLTSYFTSIFFVLLTIIFLTSLLNFFHAPTYKIWFLQIFASEYSILFIQLTIGILLLSFVTGYGSLVQLIISLSAIAIYFYPLVRAYFLAQQLPNDLEKAFGKFTDTQTKPFDFTKLLSKVPKVPRRSLTYSETDGVTLKLDYYNSAIEGKRPCVVVIHGGSWVSGDSKQLASLNSRLVEIGYNVAAINYRLTPKWNFPAPIEDTTAALKYLRAHADELNIDSDNFVVLGRSAGGQIALLTAYTITDLGIKGVVNFYGPADMIWGYHTETNPLVIDGKQVISRYLGGPHDQLPDRYVACSPIEFVNEQTVPTLTLHGTTDSLVFEEHAFRLARKLDQFHVSNYFLRLPWATHGFDYHLYGPGGQLSTYAIEHFLHKVTK